MRFHTPDNNYNFVMYIFWRVTDLDFVINVCMFSIFENLSIFPNVISIIRFF